jgi:DNA primase
MNTYEFKEYCQEIRKAHKITDYAKSAGLALKNKGGRWWLLCPFHGERTPSLTINDGSDGSEFFHCFGCGKSGSIIDFYAHYENIDPKVAIMRLGSGIDIEFDVERLFREFEKDIDKTDAEKIAQSNLSISKTCFNYLREIKSIVSEDIYKAEFENINKFYEKLDKHIKGVNIEAVYNIEKEICFGDFIIDKVKYYEGKAGYDEIVF